MAPQTELQGRAGRQGVVTSFLGRLGAPVVQLGTNSRAVLAHISGIAHLFLLTLYLALVGPFRRLTQNRHRVFDMMRNVGVRSLAIVALVSFLIGAILVLQTATVMK